MRLAGAIIGEPTGTTFYLLGMAIKRLPPSTVQAIWAGAGSALTALVSVPVFRESFTALRARPSRP
ncbi:DMT family transporter [Deinobacterium chartae]|nr:SMR family transporter [Deinobacterium chartae]